MSTSPGPTITDPAAVAVNNAPKALPTIEIAWDQDIQDIKLVFDHEQFKTFDFMLGLLEMARIRLDAQRQLSFAQAMQAKAMQQQAQQQAAMQQARKVQSKLLVP